MSELQEKSPQRPADEKSGSGERQKWSLALRAPLGRLLRSRWKWPAVGVGVFLMLAAIGGLTWWWTHQGHTDEVERLLQAVDREDWETVQNKATEILARKSPQLASLRAALYGQLAAYAVKADKQKGMERRRYFTLAARFGERAAALGFPPGREADGAFLLGRTLHYLGRFAESRKYLREAAKQDPQKQPRVDWLMAESYLLDPQASRAEALKFNQAFLLTPGLDRQSQDAGYLQQSQIYLALGKPDSAEKSLQQLTPQGRESPEADLLRGRIALSKAEKFLQDKNSPNREEGLKYAAEARSLFDRVRGHASSTDNLRARATYFLGLAIAQAEDYEAALMAWERCYTEFSDYPEAWSGRFQLALLSHRLGRYDRSVEELATCIRAMEHATLFLNPWVGSQEIRQAVEQMWNDCLTKKLFPLALKLANAMDGVFPPGEVFELRAKTYLAWSDHLEALTREGEQSEENRTLARRYLRMAGDDLTRLALYRAATRFYTEDLWQAGESYFRGGSYTRASRILREYLRNEARRRNPQALLRLGECLLAMGKTNDALRVLYECIEFHAKDAACYQARLWAAHAHMEKGEFDKAEAVLMENLSGELAPTSLEWRDSLFALATLYFRMGRDREAMEKLEEAVRRYPEDPRTLEARYFLGELYVRAAIEELGQQDSLDSAHPAGSRDLVLRALQQFQIVQRELDTHWETGTTTPHTRKLLRNVYFALGDAYYRLGQFGEAITTYITLTNRLQSEPEVLEAYVQMARCYRAMGRNRETQITLEQAKIVLNRFPQDVTFEKTTPFTREEWSTRLAWFNQHM